MPRKEVNPLTKILEAFETAPLGQAEFALEVAQTIVRRRRTAAAPTPSASTPAAQPKKKRAKKPAVTRPIGAPAAPAETVPAGN